jgi:hypothetical protein
VRRFSDALLASDSTSSSKTFFDHRKKTYRNVFFDEWANNRVVVCNVDLDYPCDTSHELFHRLPRISGQSIELRPQTVLKYRLNRSSSAIRFDIHLKCATILRYLIRIHTFEVISMPSPPTHPHRTPTQPGKTSNKLQQTQLTDYWADSPQPSFKTSPRRSAANLLTSSRSCDAKPVSASLPTSDQDFVVCVTASSEKFEKRIKAIDAARIES